MAKDNGKDESDKARYGEEKYHAPEMKGGRRGRTPASLANLKPWPKGTSGNPLGQPKSVVDLNRYVRDNLHPVYEELLRLFYDPETATRDKVAIAALLDARGCGRPAIGVFHGSTGPGMPPGHLPEGDDGAPSALLLRAAREGKSEERIIAELK